MVQYRQGLNDLSRVRRQTQKLDVFVVEIRALSWISETHDYLEQGCPTRDPPYCVSRLAATFVNDTQGVPRGIYCFRWTFLELISKSTCIRSLTFMEIVLS